jgi:hypothetical protein
MMKRRGSKTMAKRVLQGMALLCTALMLGAAGGRPAQAQAQTNAGDQGVYTYVALWDTPRAQWGDIEKFYKDARPALDKLVAGGTLVGWGNARAFVHDASGFTHANWITATSFANLSRALETIHSALPQPAAFANSKHVDEILRATIHGGKPGASGTGMLWVASYELRSGQAEEFTRLFESEIKPLFEEQVAAGTILSYSLNFQAVHTGTPGGVSIAYVLPDVAGIDKFQAALAAYEGQHPELGPAMEATMDYAAHRDSLYEVLSFGQK